MEYYKNQNPSNKIRGLRNRTDGKIFEQMIQASCELYKARGAAFIEKTPEPMKIIGVLNRSGNGGIFKAVFEKRAQPDFKGTLAGGKSICFEAKTTNSDRINQSAVSVEQSKCFDLHTSLGAVCFVLVSFGFQNFYRIPWPDWQNMKTNFGHKYVTENNLKNYKVRAVAGNILFLGVRAMEGNCYQEAAMRTASAKTSDDLILNGVMGLCGESGECIDAVKKHKGGE